MNERMTGRENDEDDDNDDDDDDKKIGRESRE